MQTRDLVLVLVGEQREVVSCDRVAQLLTARTHALLGRRDAVDERAIAVRVGAILILCEERLAAGDRFG